MLHLVGFASGAVLDLFNVLWWVAVEKNRPFLAALATMAYYSLPAFSPASLFCAGLWWQSNRRRCKISITLDIQGGRRPCKRPSPS